MKCTDSNVNSKLLCLLLFLKNYEVFVRISVILMEEKILWLFSNDFSIIVEIKSTETEPPHNGGRESDWSEAVFVNHLRSPEFDSQSCGIPGLRKCLQIRPLINHSPFHRCWVVLFLRISFLYTYSNKNFIIISIYKFTTGANLDGKGCLPATKTHKRIWKTYLLEILSFLFIVYSTVVRTGGREGGRGRDLDNWDKWETGLCYSYLFCAYDEGRARTSEQSVEFSTAYVLKENAHLIQFWKLNKKYYYLRIFWKVKEYDYWRWNFPF
jgi:hypothetical protein